MNKTKITNSPTHGKGIFATQDIKTGEVILKWDISKQINESELKNLSKKERKYICNVNNKYIQMQEPERYINHSCDPNSTVSEFCDIATRDIKVGEEITGNYNEVSSNGPEIDCNCGSKNCIGKIFS